MKRYVSLMLIVFFVFTLFCFSINVFAAGAENPIILRYAHVERIETPLSERTYRRKSNYSGLPECSAW